MFLRILSIVRQKTPMSTKVFFAKLLIYILFFLKKIINRNFLSIYLLGLLMKIGDLEKVKLLISEHADDVNFCRFLEYIERYKALGLNANNIRLDFDPKKYQKLLDVNEGLIQQFPDDYLLHDRMARNYLAGGEQSKARKYFALSLKLQRKQKNLKEKTGLIVFISMPRSGTGFVSKSLKEGLKLKNLESQIQYVDSWFPDYGIFEFPSYVADNKFNPMPDGFISGHAAALQVNLWNLSLITDKVVVNFRDPRQAILSWVHYMEYLRYTGNVSGLVEYKIPDGYFQWSFEQQIDWQIDNYFIKVNINWIMGWLNADKDKEFPCKIHFSQHELLATNQEKYFEDILLFYGIPKEKFKFPNKPEFKVNTHKRRGLTDEWRSVLTNEQVERINKLIPLLWFEKFNWPIR